MVTGQLTDTPTHGLPTHTLDNWQTGHPTDWSTCGLDKSRTRQLMDPPAVAVLVVITLIYGHKTLHWSQHVLGAINMLGQWFVTLFYMRIIMQLKLKLQVLLLAASTSCLVRELTSPWDVQFTSRLVCKLAICKLAYPRVVQLPQASGCPVKTMLLVWN